MKPRPQAAFTAARSEIETLFATLKERATQIQKVNERFGSSKAAPRVVVNDQ